MNLKRIEAHLSRCKHLWRLHLPFEVDFNVVISYVDQSNHLKANFKTTRNHNQLSTSSYNPTMKLLTLHPDILLHFFNTQFSLQELFHLRSISRNLCHLIESLHCIGRLTFCFKTSNFEQQIVAHLGPHCTSLRLHCVNLSNNCALIERMRDNSIKLKHLRLTHHFSDPNRKNHLTQPLSYKNCFTQLCSLELIYYARKYVDYYTGPDMQSLLHLLVPLKQLNALTLVGLEIETFENFQVNLPVLTQITRLSINAGYRKLKNPDLWFHSLSRAFPTVRRLTLAFNLNYSIDLNTHLSRNFVHCTHFRMLNLHYKNNVAIMSETLPSALARHHQRRFRSEDTVFCNGMCIERWWKEVEDEQHEVEQLWMRKSSGDKWTRVLNGEKSVNCTEILVWNTETVKIKFDFLPKCMLEFKG